MAIYHLTDSVISRGKGQSVVAAAAYQSRARLYDERDEKAKDYSGRVGQDLLFSGVYVPKDAPEWARDAEKLWNAVERAEDKHNKTRKASATLAHTIDLALMAELTPEQNRYALQDFIRETFVREGRGVQASIHGHEQGGDARNIHAHLLVTLRPLNGDGFGAEKPRLDRAAMRQQVLGWREAWAKTASRHLKRHGFEIEAERVRWGHLQIEEQRAKAIERGDMAHAATLDREPTAHLGATATRRERRGAGSERGEINRAIEDDARRRRALREELEAAEREIAALEAEAARLAIEQAQANQPQEAGEHLPSPSERWSMSTGSRFEASPASVFGQMPTASRLEISPPQPAETRVQGTEGKEHAPEHRPTAANRPEPSRKTQAGRAFARVSQAGDGQQGGGERPQTRASPVVRDWNQATAPPRPEASSPATGKQGEGRGEDAPSLKPSNDNTRRTPRETTRQSFRRRGGAGRSRDRTPDRGGED
jgi:hypothetical protein